MASKRYVVAACLGALCAACSPAPVGAASPVVLYPGSAEGDAALLRGTLEQEGTCLYIRAEGGERWLAAFPSPGTSWNSKDRSVRVNGRVLRVGEAGGFGGGERKDGLGALAWVQAPAAACDPSQIWLVTALMDT